MHHLALFGFLVRALYWLTVRLTLECLPKKKAGPTFGPAFWVDPHLFNVDAFTQLRFECGDLVGDFSDFVEERVVGLDTFVNKEGSAF